MKTLILLGSALLLLPSCAAKLEEPELKLAPLVRLENFIVLDMGTVTMGHMTINALMTAEGAKYLEDNKRQIRRLEERLNAWYHKALRRLTYLRLNDPRETPIIITDLFKEVGDPIDAFYRDERRRKSDLELGRRAIHMSFNNYICQVIRALDKEDEKLRFKLWQESKKDD